MQSTSLADLLTSVSDRADLPVLTTTTFITKAQMVRWLNQSGRRLAGILIESHGEGHFETTQNENTVVDQDYVSLSSYSASETDIFRITGVRVTIDGERLRLQRAQGTEIDMEDDNTDNGWTVGRPPKWVFREYENQKMLWTRTPKAVHAVKIHYVPYFVFVSITGESVDGIAALATDSTHHIRSHMGWDEWVVLDCAIKAMKRQDLPVETWQALKIEQDELEGHIRAAAPKRTDEPQQIQQTYYGRNQGNRWLTD